MDFSRGGGPNVTYFSQGVILQYNVGLIKWIYQTVKHNSVFLMECSHSFSQNTRDPWKEYIYVDHLFILKNILMIGLSVCLKFRGMEIILYIYSILWHRSTTTELYNQVAVLSSQREALPWPLHTHLNTMTSNACLNLCPMLVLDGVLKEIYISVPMKVSRPPVYTCISQGNVSPSYAQNCTTPICILNNCNLSTVL